jgi:uncharacterized protein
MTEARAEGEVDRGPPGFPEGQGGAPERGMLHALDPRVRILWRVSAGIRAVIWTGAVAVVEFLGWPRGLLEALLPGWVEPGMPTAGVAALGLVLLLVIPSLGYRRWRYALRDHDLWIRKGIVVHRVSVLPYRRLQFVDTLQGPLERWMGLMELVVHTAAPGTSGRIPGLAAAEAETLREVLSRFGPDEEEDG